MQKLAEQMVIAIPLLARVQRDQEHVRARELRQHRSRVVATEDRVAQLGREPSQHRSALQKVPGVGRERAQNLIGQVVGDVPGAADECQHTLIGVLEVTKPQRRQVLPGRPALRTLDEQLDALVGQRDPLTHHQLMRFVDRERQLARANLHQRPSRPQARHADRRVRARRREHAHVVRQSLDRVADRSKRTLAPDRVQIIEHDRYRTTVRDQAVHQLVDRSLDPRTPDAEAHQRRTSEAPTEPVDRRGEMRPQPHRVVVGRVKRHPNHGLPALDTPQPQESRLAIANRRVDHSQRGPAIAVEQLKQACSPQHPGLGPGQHQLRLDQQGIRTICPRGL